MGNYILCPFYLKDQRQTISCEDCIRRFNSKEARINHVRTFCADQWKKCKWAINLNEIYERTKDMGENEIKKEVAEDELAESRKYNKLLVQQLAEKDAAIQDMIDVGKKNYETYRKDLEHLRQQVKNEQTLRMWANDMLAYQLIKGNAPLHEFILNRKEISEALMKYHLALEEMEDGNIKCIVMEKKNVEEETN